MKPLGRSILRRDWLLLGMALATLTCYLVFRPLFTIGLILTLVGVGVRLLGIVRRRLLWKIRNRLIVAGIFFVVAPLFLISVFFLLVINIVIYQNNLVIFENAMIRQVAGLEPTLSVVLGMADETRIRNEFKEFADENSPYPKPAALNLVFTHGLNGNAPPFFVFPKMSPLREFPMARGLGVFQTGYFRFRGVLYHGILMQRGEYQVLAARRIDQAFFDQLPPIGDFKVRYIVPEARSATGGSYSPSPINVAEVEKAGGFDRYQFTLPYMFRFRDFDASQPRPPSEYHRFLLINDFSKIIASVRSTDRSRIITERLETIEKQLLGLGGGPERSKLETERSDLLKEDEFIRRRNSTAPPVNVSVIIRILIVLFVLVIVASFWIGFRTVRVITRSVDQLHRGTERVRRGDFTYRVRIRSQDQMRELAESFNEMASGIDRLLMEEKEKQRLEEELRIARSIQLRLLPPDTRQCGPFDIAAVNVPAQEIAGDYFDYFYGPEHQLSVLVADVSGKGASAAFYMAELKGVINLLQSSGLTPSEIILECHRSLMPTFDRVTFVTMNLARFDADSHTLVYARAGHTPALFYEAASGTCRELTPKGLAIGLSALTNGGTQEVTLPYRPGDVLFFFSDGLSELADPDGEMFGVERIRRVLERSAGESAGEIRQRMLDESIVFARNAANKDDMTFLIVRCT